MHKNVSLCSEWAFLREESLGCRCSLVFLKFSWSCQVSFSEFIIIPKFDFVDPEVWWIFSVRRILPLTVALLLSLAELFLVWSSSRGRFSIFFLKIYLESGQPWINDPFLDVRLICWHVFSILFPPILRWFILPVARCLFLQLVSCSTVKLSFCRYETFCLDLLLVYPVNLKGEQAKLLFLGLIFLYW